MNILNIIGRSAPLFQDDLISRNSAIQEEVNNGRFLIIGGAGSIGKEVARQIYIRDPRVLHIVDISENNLVELVRDLRSNTEQGLGELKTFAIDSASLEFEALIANEEPYDYIFNLSALKHVRSEKDPYTLMRMITVNILNTLQSVRIAKSMKAKKYFCVSTDKASNPVNMMGASKRIMEMLLMRESKDVSVSMARFANVAFSDGSLLHGFNQRIIKRQPLAAPKDILRYFISPQESGELCLMSALFGSNRDIFFPKLNDTLHLISFSDIALRFLREHGFEPYFCTSEEEARSDINQLILKKKWPCYFFQSDTTGEKHFEEFYTESEALDMDMFSSIGVIKNEVGEVDEKLNTFLDTIEYMRVRRAWNKRDLIHLFKQTLPNFQHKEMGKNLDQRM